MADKKETDLRHPDLVSAGLGPSLPFLRRNAKVLILTTKKGSEEIEFRLFKDRIVIGSLPSSDVKLIGDGVSPIHAVLEVSRPSQSGSGDSADIREVQVIAYDLASQAGLFINGEKAVTQVLTSGDQLSIGAFQLKYSLESLEPHAIRDQVRGKSSVSESLVPLVQDEEPVRVILETPSVGAPTGKASSVLGAAPFAPSTPKKAPVNSRRLESFDSDLAHGTEESFTSLLLEDRNGAQQIFDYNTGIANALEVVMSWQGMILEIKHFTTNHAVTLGEFKKSDFVIPPFLESKQFHLVDFPSGASVAAGTGPFTLNLHSKMTGVIQKNSSLLSIEELKESKPPGADTFSLAFGVGDVAKISLGDIDFYLRFTEPPPRLKPQKLFDRDPLFSRIVITSLLLTLVTVTALSKMKVVQSLEAERVPDRLASILYQPEKYVSRVRTIHERTPTPPIEEKKEVPPKKEEPPKIVLKPEDFKKQPNAQIQKGIAQGKTTPNKGIAKNAQKEAKEGEGARAKGPEGKRGSQIASKHSNPQALAKRPSANGGQGRGGGNSQAEDEGNVDFLKGATNKIQNLLGSSASKLGKGGEKLQGFGAFNSEGTEGLALSGNGKGGGGTADSLGGLSNKGKGGGRVGTGKGAAGNDNGIIGGKGRSVPLRLGSPEEVVVMGAVDASAILAAIIAHKDEFRYCYENELKTSGKKLMGGSVIPNFVIGASGRVTHVAIESDSLGNQNVRDCVGNVLKAIDFPVPNGGGIVQVSFPFKFSPQM